MERRVAALTSKSAGFFGGKVLDFFSDLAIEDEGRLRNFRIRENFLTKLFTLAHFREVKKSNRMVELVKFHTSNKFLLMSYNQKELGILGRIVANPEKKKFSEIITDYDEHLKRALASVLRIPSKINVLMHGFGHFSKDLSHREKEFFLEKVEEYRNIKIPLSTVLSVLKSWVIRFEEDYLMKQTFFDPFPEDLIEIGET